MKRNSKIRKIWAVVGAGLLVAAVSGSAFAMRITEANHISSGEVRRESSPTTQTSPLPTPAPQPSPEPQKQIEFTGTVEVMAADMWVVGGRTLAVTAATEIEPGLDIGVLAKVHAVQQADGTLWAREIELAGSDDQSNGNTNENENDNDNSNDDHGGNVNSNDDNGNDDHGGNVNSNDDNGNDDHGGNVNSNEDNGNDDHGGNVNSNGGNGNDNHGGGNRNDDHGGRGGRSN